MFKSSVNLFKIDKAMKATFNVIIKGDTNEKYPLLSFNNFNGNDYFKINGNPYVQIELLNPVDKNEGWNTNRCFNLTRLSLFSMRRELFKLIKIIKDEKTLFTLLKGKLQINKELANKCCMSFKAGDKVIAMLPAIVYDGESVEMNEYEGCTIMINGIENYIQLTFEEMEYLYNELTMINMNELMMSIITTTYLLNINVKQHDEPKSGANVETEVVEPDAKFRLYPKQNEPTIPLI